MYETEENWSLSKKEEKKGSKQIITLVSVLIMVIMAFAIIRSPFSFVLSVTVVMIRLVWFGQSLEGIVSLSLGHFQFFFCNYTKMQIIIIIQILKSNGMCYIKSQFWEKWERIKKYNFWTFWDATFNNNNNSLFL